MTYRWQRMKPLLQFVFRLTIVFVAVSNLMAQGHRRTDSLDNQQLIALLQSLDGNPEHVVQMALNPDSQSIYSSVMDKQLSRMRSEERRVGKECRDRRGLDDGRESSGGWWGW